MEFRAPQALDPPPRYFDVVEESTLRDENLHHQDERAQMLPPQPSAPPEPAPQLHLPYSREVPPSPQTLPDYTEPAPPLENNFTIVRFIFCWTGLATEVSGCTCFVCGSWYILLGLIGLAVIIYPYLYHSEYLHSSLVLFTLAGLSCLLLSFMWCCTQRFFYATHPHNKLHDSHNYRLSRHVNSGYIVCCFLVACAVFFSITMTLVYSMISSCRLFDPPVLCFYTYYDIVLTSSMSFVVIVFLCFNTLCYFHFIKRNVGSIC